jgi:hypothetical protein
MVFLPYTGASRYRNCCIDGGTIPEYFGYFLVYVICNRCKVKGTDRVVFDHSLKAGRG